MKIKVCGNTDLGQLEEMASMPIDYTGFVFYDSSPRAVLEKLDPADVRNLKVKKVGVFVNESVAEILRKVELYGLDLVQLHGDETPTFCNQVSDHVNVIKAFRVIENNADIDWMVKEYAEVCDYYLFDKGSRGVYGGTGEKFDWNILKNAKINKPFFLSGGIDIGDVEELQSFSHPFFYGIDVNTRFEISPGMKDTGKIKKFIQELQSK